MAITIRDLLAHNTNLQYDLTPTLGANLNTNNFSIINGINPVNITGNNYPITVGVAGQRLTVDGTGNIVLTAIAEIITVQKTPGPGEFSSVAAALASIVDASSTKPYEIHVQPGVYIEPPFAVKPYVAIQGSGMETTVLQAANPNVHFIISTIHDGLRDMTLTGTTGIGAALIYSSGLPGTALDAAFFDNIRFGNSDILMLTETTTLGANSTSYLQNCRIGGNYSFNQGFIARGVAGSQARFLVRNITTASTTTAPHPSLWFLASGPGAEIVLMASLLKTSGTDPVTGVGVQVEDGGDIRVTATVMRRFAKAIYAKAGGLAPNISIDATTVDGGTIDLHIEHSGTTGSFAGSADITKIIVDPANTGVSISYSNIGPGGGFAQVGGLFLGDRHDTLSDMSDLIQHATPTGLIYNGVVSKNLVTPLTVDVTAGVGYVSDAINDDSKRIAWATRTALPVVDNTNNWIYIDNNGVVTSALSIPDTSQNIILARARTSGGAIVFLALIPFDATHVTAKQNDFLRNAIGPLFGTGMLVTENLVTSRTIDVTDGVYWYGTNKFQPTGGLSKAFNVFYHVAGVWTQTNNVTVIDNTQYDDGSNLQPLTTNYFVKHVLYVSGDGVNQSMSLIYGRGQYISLLDAQNAPLPLQPGYFVDIATPIAALIVQQGVNSIAQVIDVRPRVGFQAPSTTGAAVHGNLLGLTADDHPQYLLVGGTRAMGGNLNLGTFSVTNGTWAGNTISVAKGGTGLTTTGTANQILGTDAAGTALEYKTVTGTTDQITTTHSVNAITLSIPTTFTSPGSVTATTNFIAGTATASYTSTLGTGITVIPNSAATTTSHGSNTTVRGGPGGTVSGDGGDVSLFGGVPTAGSGGNILIGAANAQGAVNGNGGNVSIAAGVAQGTGTPGMINLLSTTTISSGNLVVSGLTPNSFLYSGTAGTLTTTATPTNGQLLIGSTGVAPVASTLTATANQLAITNGAGSITLALASNPIIPGTGSATIPAGTTAQRPVAPTDAMLRFNSTEEILEGYSNPYAIFQSPTAIQRTQLYRKRRSWYDEFMSGNTATDLIGAYGDMNWTMTSPAGQPSVVYTAAVTDHPGILAISTGATLGNNITLSLGDLTTTPVIMSNQVEYFSWLVRIPTITTITAQFGVGQDIATVTTFGTNGVLFLFDSVTNANWQFVTRSGGVATAITTTLAVAANTWYLLEAFFDGTTWTPVINGVKYTSSSTNVPAAAVNVGSYIQTNTAAPRTVEFDAFSMITRELGQRY